MAATLSRMSSRSSPVLANGLVSASYNVGLPCSRVARRNFGE